MKVVGWFRLIVVAAHSFDFLELLLMRRGSLGERPAVLRPTNSSRFVGRISRSKSRPVFGSGTSSSHVSSDLGF